MDPLGSFQGVLNVLPREKIEGPPRDFLKANLRPHPRPDQRPKTRGAAGLEGFAFGLWSFVWPLFSWTPTKDKKCIFFKKSLEQFRFGSVPPPPFWTMSKSKLTFSLDTFPKKSCQTIFKKKWYDRTLHSPKLLDKGKSG